MSANEENDSKHDIHHQQDDKKRDQLVGRWIPLELIQHQ